MLCEEAFKTFLQMERVGPEARPNHYETTGEMQVNLKSSVNDVGLAMYGYGQDALQVFDQMKKK